MQDQNNSNLYRYNLAPGGKRAKAPTAEEDHERYYSLVRLKLAPRRLRWLSALNVCALVGVLFALFIGSLLLEKPSFSVLEKRDLAKFPELSAQNLFQGSLTHDIETWFADTFPMRDWFVAFSAVVDESRGVRVDDVRIIAPSGADEAQDMPKTNSIDVPNGPAKAPGTANIVPGAFPESNIPPENVNSAAGSEAVSSSEPQAELQNENPVDEGAVGAISNGTFVYKGMAMSLFGGSNQNAKWYADTLNTYRQELPDVQIYNMIIPTAIEFYVPNKYRDLTASQKDTIDYTYSQLDSSIKRVDAYAKLEAHKKEYLYFRTDHHWTGLGAYYAYTAFCEQAGLTPVSLESCETRRLTDFIGTMYAQTQDTTLLQNPDYVDYYLFPVEYTAERFMRGAPYTPISHDLWGEYAQSPNSYSVFLQGDFPLISVKTNVHNGRKIMVVKESFGNAFAPFLINNYEEVYIVDQRYFQLPAIEFIKQQGINELIFVNNSFAVCTPYHIRCIDGLRHQYFAPAVPAVQPEPSASSSEAAPPESSSSEAVPAMAQPEPQIPVEKDLSASDQAADSAQKGKDGEESSSTIPHKRKKSSSSSKSSAAVNLDEMDDRERTAYLETEKETSRSDS